MVVCIKCNTNEHKEIDAKIPLKHDHRFVMKFKMMECEICGWISATEEQRKHNEDTYNMFFKMRADKMLFGY